MDLHRILINGTSGCIPESHTGSAAPPTSFSPTTQEATGTFPGGVATNEGARLYALHNNGVAGLTHFIQRSGSHGAVEAMCVLAVNLVGKSFPPGFNRISFDFHARVDSVTPRGWTQTSRDQAKVSVGVMPDIEWANDLDMHGMIAYTVFHELFLHALPDLRNHYYQRPETTEDQDHWIICSPPNGSNLLHQAIKSVLPHLPVHLKQFFVDAYIGDVMEEQSLMLAGDDKTALMAWGQELDRQSHDLDSAFWQR